MSDRYVKIADRELTAEVRLHEPLVVIQVNDYEAIARCFTEEWRGSFYDFYEEEDVLSHLAWNCLHNGYRDASQMDGWADLERGVVTMRNERTTWDGSDVYVTSRITDEIAITDD